MDSIIIDKPANRIKSLDIRSCHATYIESNKFLVCSQGCDILIFNKSHNLIKKLSINDSPIISIINHHHYKQKIYSIHNSGQILLWDLSNFNRESEIFLDSEIIDLAITKVGFVIVTPEFKAKMYDVDGVFQKEIFSKFKVNKVHVGGNLSQYIVSRFKDVLMIYWPAYDSTQKISIGNNSEKNITSLCCGKSKEVIAVGHKSGEITVIWNLISDADVVFEDTKMNLPDKNLPWKPTPSAYLKRNTLHWHFNPVQALEFSSSDKQLISGGLEGVLVKWDLSEAIGDYKHRQFLPRLGSPISQIKCIRGYDSVDNILVQLEDNSLHVYSMNFDPKLVTSNLGQIPHSGGWSRLPEIELKTGLRGYTQSLALHFLNVPSTDGQMGLMSTSLGKLQVFRCQKDQLEIFQKKLPITGEQTIPRDQNMKPAYSDCLLIDSMPRCDGISSELWVVTYSELVDWNEKHHLGGKIFSNQRKDNQSRVSWWLFNTDKKELTSSPVDSHCLDFLASPCIGLKFVQNRQKNSWQTILLTADSRLVIFDFDQQSFLTRKYSIWPYLQTISLDLKPTRSYIETFNRINNFLNSFKSADSDFILVQITISEFSIYNILNLTNDLFPEAVLHWKEVASSLPEGQDLSKTRITQILPLKISDDTSNGFLIVLLQKEPFIQSVTLVTFDKEENGSLIMAVKATQVLTTHPKDKFSLVQAHPKKAVFALMRLRAGDIEVYSYDGSKISKTYTIPKVINNEGVIAKTFESESLVNYECLLQFNFICDNTEEHRFFLASLALTKDDRALKMERKIHLLTTDTKEGEEENFDTSKQVMEVIAECHELEASMNTSILTMAKPVAQNVNINSSSSDIDQERLTRKRKMIEPVNKVLSEISKFPSHLAPNPENILKQIYRQD